MSQVPTEHRHRSLDMQKRHTQAPIRWSFNCIRVRGLNQEAWQAGIGVVGKKTFTYQSTGDILLSFPSLSDE